MRILLLQAKKLYKNEYEINKNNCILFLVELMYFWRVLQNVPTKELKTLLSSIIYCITLHCVICVFNVFTV